MRIANAAFGSGGNYRKFEFPTRNHHSFHLPTDITLYKPKLRALPNTALECHVIETQALCHISQRLQSNQLFNQSTL